VDVVVDLDVVVVVVVPVDAQASARQRVIPTRPLSPTLSPLRGARE